MKLPFTIRFEYSSRKKKGGLRGLGEALGGSPLWFSNGIVDDRAGECGMGGTLGGCALDGEYEGVVGEGVPWPVPLPFCCWLPLFERPPKPWRTLLKKEAMVLRGRSNT